MKRVWRFRVFAENKVGAPNCHHTLNSPLPFALLSRSEVSVTAFIRISIRTGVSQGLGIASGNSYLPLRSLVRLVGLAVATSNSSCHCNSQSREKVPAIVIGSGHSRLQSHVIDVFPSGFTIASERVHSQSQAQVAAGFRS